MSRNDIIAGLTPTQADGLACVVCGTDYLLAPVPNVPVGRAVTGSQVFACVDCDPGEPQPPAGGVPR